MSLTCSKAGPLRVIPGGECTAAFDASWSAPENLESDVNGRRTAALVCSAAALAVVAGCGGDSAGPGEPRIQTVVVESPIGAVLAAGSGATFVGRALTASSTPVNGAVFSWESTNPAVATVSSAGLVQALSEGNASIRATADSVTGSLAIRVISPDLAGIEALLDDAYHNALVADLGPAAAGVGDALDACRAALSSGNMTALNDCIVNLLAFNTSGNPDDSALLPVLRLYWGFAATLLDF